MNTSFQNIPRKIAVAWGGPLLVAAVYFFFVQRYWRKWGDIFIDFGREVFIPWQLCDGKVLYRDIDYILGPLAPYLNCLWFKISEVSITTIFVCNLLVVALILLLIYKIIIAISDEITATMSCLIFLSLFAFSPSKIFSFISPYDHNITYGFLLSILMIYFLINYSLRPSLLNISFAGLCLGLVFLTKSDIFVAAAITATISLLVNQKLFKPPSASLIKICLVFLGMMILPIIGFVAYFSTQMPIVQAVKGTFANWYFLFNTKIVTVNYYKDIMGFDEPLNNFLLMIISFLFYMVLLISFLIIEFIYNGIIYKYKTNILGGYLVLLVLSSLLIFTHIKSYHYADNIFNYGELLQGIIGRPLPLLSICMISISLLLLLRKTDQVIYKPYSYLLIWSIFGLLMLAKIILNSQISSYGFVLSVPSFITLIIAILWLIPRLLISFIGKCYVFRKLAIMSIMILFIGIIFIDNKRYSEKDILIGSGSNSFYINEWKNKNAEGSAEIFKQVVNYIKSSIPIQATLLVVPEGAMINYLTRHNTSIPLFNFSSPEFSAFGETYIIGSLEKNPPDYILLTTPLKKKGFGSDWGAKTLAWVEKNYIQIMQLGEEPLGGEKFGLKLMKFNPLSLR